LVHKASFEKEADYSDLLHALTVSPAERVQLLRPFFEPTEEEQEQRLKQPTEAHRAIADLVAKGYVRVLVTPNFDRLLETSLAQAGVQPTVITSADDVKGALPLTHSPCTVVKVHGDYLDARLRNTRNELEKYDEALDKLLDEILDNYGLVVCGWSGDWDTALRNAITRAPNRRFGMYWAARGGLSENAKTLVARRGATVMKIEGADHFFKGLRDSVEALDQFSQQDPRSPAVAVARVKRYLSNDQYRIALHDFIFDQTEQVYEALNGATFTPSTR